MAKKTTNDLSFNQLIENSFFLIRDSKTAAAVNYFAANLDKLQKEFPGYLHSETIAEYKERNKTE